MKCRWKIGKHNPEEIYMYTILSLNENKNFEISYRYFYLK